MKKKLAVLLGATMALSACDVPLGDIYAQSSDTVVDWMNLSQPAAMLIYTEDGAETLLRGDTRRQWNGELYFEVSGPDWGACEGLVSARLEVVSLTCENGYSFTDALKADASGPSGLMEFRGNANGKEYVAFFGWGDQATDDALRAAFSDYVNQV